ncbi:MAG: 50S ribosomal protein L24 [Chromatiales bacterium]|jgi:large subunit ribosomal protein L24|nr:50S ribosomal protein L24 [Chromatiales bacterium]
MRKLRKGDEVIVIAGKDKGKRGTITQMLAAETNRVLVDNVNMVKKHQKPNPNMGMPGGIVDKEMPIQISNIAIFNPASGKADRVGIKILEDGRKVRVFKSNNEVIDA